MCYEILLLGRHPFDGATTADLVRAIIHESPPDAPSMYSREFVDTVNKLLNKDPTERMTMHQLLTSPALQHKVAAIPATYKPKYHMEDRFRRAQVKQLIHQIESLGISSKSAHSLQHHGSSTHHSGIESIEENCIHLVILFNCRGTTCSSNVTFVENR